MPRVTFQLDVCDRSERRIAPETTTDGARFKPPPRPRVNGWSPPVHPAQMAVWLMLLEMAGVTFGVFIPLLPSIWKDTAYGVAAGLFLLHLVVHVVATSIDPAEPSVQYSRNNDGSVPSSDSFEPAEVIEGLYCYLCRIRLSPKSKHCRACHKCISGFDHHCNWINNCVGSRNYWWFFSSVASAVVMVLFLIVLIIYVLVQGSVDQRGLRTDPHFANIPDPDTWPLFLPYFSVKTKTPVFLLVAVAELLLGVSSLVLLGQLLVFHLCLVMKNTSTYDYVTRGKREGPKSSTEDLHTEEGFPQQNDENSSPSDHGRGKSKKVLPSRWYPRLCLPSSIHPESSTSVQSVEDQQQETGPVDSKGAGHESPATGGGSPVPAEGLIPLWSFSLETLERLPLPNILNPSSPRPSSPELGGAYHGGQKPQRSGSNTSTNKPEEEPSFHEGRGLQQGPLPEPKEAESMGGDPAAGEDTAASGDMPFSQVATGPPAAQGEVRVDLSSVFNLHESVSVVISLGDKLEPVVVPMDDELESVVIPMANDIEI